MTATFRESSSLVLPVQNRFGAMAVRKGLLTEKQLEEAFQVQKAAAKAGFRRRLGEILIRKGYLTAQQVKNIMANQSIGHNRKRIGNFELLSKLGQGAMGVVFKARQLTLNRIVALKVLSSELADNKEYRRRFVHEARTVARLNHPHIVNAIDVGIDDDTFYFAMEYVDGESLGQGLVNRDGAYSEAAALRYAEQIAEALNHAHENGLLHRDVKPDNILLDKNGNAKLADLGLARPTHPRGSILDTQFGERSRGLVVGTPHYIAPEQAQGSRHIGPAADLYSLGATLFHLITGRPPFDGPNSHAIMTRHCLDDVPNPAELDTDISPRTAAICMRLMAKDPEDRYPNGWSAAEDIRAALKELDAPATPRESRTESRKSTRLRGRRKRGKGGGKTNPGTTKMNRRKLRHLTRGGGAGEMAMVIAALLLLGAFVVAYLLLK